MNVTSTILFLALCIACASCVPVKWKELLSHKADKSSKPQPETSMDSPSTDQTATLEEVSSSDLIFQYENHLENVVKEAEEAFASGKYAECMDVCERYREDTRRLRELKGQRRVGSDSRPVTQLYLDSCKALVVENQEKIAALDKQNKNATYPKGTLDLKLLKRSNKNIAEQSLEWFFDVTGKDWNGSPLTIPEIHVDTSNL